MPVALRWPVAFSGRPLSSVSEGWEATSESSVRLTWRPLRATSVMPFLWPSSSSSTTMGRKMSCSSKRNRLVGSCSSTLVSSTNSVFGPVRVRRGRTGAASNAAGLASVEGLLAERVLDGAAVALELSVERRCRLAGAAVADAGAGAGAGDAGLVLRPRAGAGFAAVAVLLEAGAVACLRLRGAAAATASAASGRSSAGRGSACWAPRTGRKASGESLAARRPGAGGRGIVDEPFLNRDQKAQSRLETEAALVG